MKPGGDDSDAPVWFDVIDSPDWPDADDDTHDLAAPGGGDDDEGDDGGPGDPGTGGSTFRVGGVPAYGSQILLDSDGSQYAADFGQFPGPGGESFPWGMDFAWGTNYGGQAQDLFWDNSNTPYAGDMPSWANYADHRPGWPNPQISTADPLSGHTHHLVLATTASGNNTNHFTYPLAVAGCDEHADKFFTAYVSEGDQLDIAVTARATAPSKNPEVYLDAWFKDDGLNNVGGSWHTSVSHTNGEPGFWFQVGGSCATHHAPTITVPTGAKYMVLELTFNPGSGEEPEGAIHLGELVIGLSEG